MSRWPLAVMLAGIIWNGEPTRDIFSAEGIVQGVVRTATGNPVPDAWVVLEGGYPPGNGNSEPLYDSVRTDASGHYVGQVGVLNLPDAIATLMVRVWPPSGAGLAPAVATDLEIRITADLPPADTLVVNFTLSQGGSIAAHSPDRPHPRRSLLPGA